VHSIFSSLNMQSSVDLHKFTKHIRAADGVTIFSLNISIDDPKCLVTPIARTAISLISC